MKKVFFLLMMCCAIVTTVAVEAGDIAELINGTWKVVGTLDKDGDTYKYMYTRHWAYNQGVFTYDGAAWDNTEINGNVLTAEWKDPVKRIVIKLELTDDDTVTVTEEKYSDFGNEVLNATATRKK
jgi:hypothetical protein